MDDVDHAQSSENGSASPDNGASPTWKSIAGVVAIVLISIGALIGRLWDLARLPGGLADTEAAHGVLARQANDFGHRWLIDGAGELSSVLAAVIALVGAIRGFDPETPRIAAAVLGAASVLLTGLWIRREMGPIWGIAAATVLAGSFWHILFSRLALGPIVGVFALSALLWCLSEASHRSGRPALPWYALTGALTGLAFLSTPALRLLPVALIGIAVMSIYRWRAGDETVQPRNWIVALTAMLPVASLLVLGERQGIRTLTPWEPTPGLPDAERAAPLTITGELIATFRGLVLPGDAERGMNLPPDAYLSIVVIPWAVFGVLGLIAASNDDTLRDRFLAAGAGVIAILIGVSAVDAGHPGQLVILSPLLAGLTVYGFRAVLRWARLRTMRIALAALVATGIAGNAVWSADRYTTWAETLETRTALNAGTVAALQAANRLGDGDPVFVSAAPSGELLSYVISTVERYLVDGSSYVMFPESSGGYAVGSSDLPWHNHLEDLLAAAPPITLAREELNVSAFRLDDRIRQELPFTVPTVAYADDSVFQGHVLHVESEDRATLLLAWNLPANHQARFADLRLHPVDRQIEPAEVTATLRANPLDGRVYQVVVVEIAIPALGEATDLEIRLRGPDGNVIPTSNVDPDGYLFLNRYVFGGDDDD
jgi:4-amino-4-deoxy-L-arabinose transferase-like glycosyltransferase